jgi:hypothetical protein
MATLLQWPADERALQITGYRDLVAANRFPRRDD